MPDHVTLFSRTGSHSSQRYCQPRPEVSCHTPVAQEINDGSEKSIAYPVDAVRIKILKAKEKPIASAISGV